jgi:hypothetical protein
MKDNKKKFLILGLLALVIVSVGAFQFMGSGPAPVAETKKKAPAPAATPDPSAPKNPQYAMALTERDPFIPPPGVATVPPVTPPPTQPTTQPGRAPHPYRGSRNDGVAPIALQGNLPGVDPTGPIGPRGSGGQGGPIAVVEPTPNYQVIGVIVGDHPAAVFSDAQGNQRLVPLGGSIDADTKVVGIEKGKVFLRHGSKTLRFEMGGNPNDK